MAESPQDEAGTTSGAPVIHIVIDAKGVITLETFGTKGKQCDLLAHALESSLGDTVDRSNKETYADE